MNFAASDNKNTLSDVFNRKISYLRLSVTDFCNFKCDYCLPNGYIANGGKRPENEISASEIKTLLAGFAGLGTKKVRLTGGEPSFRKDLADIIAIAANTVGIESVALTTNGYRLHHHYQNWLDAGLNKLNISIDSFNPDVFYQMTGLDILDQLLIDVDNILDEVKKRETLRENKTKKPFELKINAILKAHTVDENLKMAMQYVKSRPVSYRFIEFMQTTHNSDVFFAEHANVSRVSHFLDSHGWVPEKRSPISGPAIEYSHPDYQGKMGFIAPYEPGFCESCNRLRVSSQGKIHLCLFDQVNHDIRPYLLRNDIAGLQTAIKSLIDIKPEHHHLHDQNSGIMHNLSIVGG